MAGEVYIHGGDAPHLLANTPHTPDYNILFNSLVLPVVNIILIKFS